MSALREWAASMGGEARAAVAVSSLGKWKTAAQVGAGLRWLFIDML
jgi:CDP-diacylglycerol--glycerol-3-phosphate 3-phosphatidyltransferase